MVLAARREVRGHLGEVFRGVADLQFVVHALGEQGRGKEESCGEAAGEHRGIRAEPARVRYSASAPGAAWSAATANSRAPSSAARRGHPPPARRNGSRPARRRRRGWSRPGPAPVAPAQGGWVVDYSLFTDDDALVRSEMPAALQFSMPRARSLDDPVEHPGWAAHVDVVHAR